MMELSSREQELLKRYREASPEGKETIRKLLERMVRRQAKARARVREVRR